MGKKLNGNYQDEMGNRYNVRIEGTRVRHTMGVTSIKMYDKFGQILRIETTANDISFFKHYREVEQRNGESVMKFAPMKKTIYSLGALREVLLAANHRYLEFLSAIDDPSNGIDKLNKITRTVHEEAPSYRGCTSLTRMRKRSCWLWCAESSPSVAKCPEFYGGSGRTGSSKRPATATSTI